MKARLEGTLGPPPQGFDAAMAGLLRLYRAIDVDDEQRQRDGYYLNAERDSQLRLLTVLMAWLRPAVEREKAGWDEADREDTAAKEWALLRAAGLEENELRALAGDR